MKALKLLAGNALILLVLLAVVLVGFEVFAERADRALWRERSARIRPFYWWSFHTPDGRRVGSQRGILELMIHPTAVYTNLPDQETPYFRINSLGLRGPDLAAPAAGRRRIVVVGGSAAFGTGLDADAETFAQQLERLLQATDVINAAVIGHRSGQEASYLATELVDLEPDLVVALDGFNDFAAILERRRRWFDMNGPEQLAKRLRLLNRLVYADLGTRLASLPAALFPHASERLAPLVERVRGGGAGEGGRPSLDETLGLDAVSSAYAGNLRKMDRIARAFGAAFLCAMQPARQSFAAPTLTAPGDRRFGGSYAEFRRRVKERLDAEGVEYLDLNEDGEGLSGEMFMDSLHLNAAGNRVMAEIVAAEITRGDLLARSAE